MSVIVYIDDIVFYPQEFNAEFPDLLKRDEGYPGLQFGKSSSFQSACDILSTSSNSSNPFKTKSVLLIYDPGGITDLLVSQALQISGKSFYPYTANLFL